MEYHGKIYGKVGDKYFDTGKTSDDWDKIEKLEADKAELLEMLKDVSKSLKETWDLNDGDNAIFDKIDTPKLDSLIQKHKQ